MRARIESTYIANQIGNRNIDVLVGCPPCQAFSTVAIAKWKSLGIPGTIQHPLNKLYVEFLKLVLDILPSYFVMENVQRMMSVKQGCVKQSYRTSFRMEIRYHFLWDNIVILSKLSPVCLDDINEH